MEGMRNDGASESAEGILTATSNPTNTIVIDSSSSSASLLSSGGSQRPQWPTIDGPLGLSEEDSIPYARRFFKFGFFLLPFLWAVNCFYFWPVLRHSPCFPRIRRYVVGSAIGFTVFAAILSSWALTFAIGGEQLFGHVWDDLVMYNVADRLGLTGPPSYKMAEHKIGLLVGPTNMILWKTLSRFLSSECKKDNFFNGYGLALT